MKFKIRSKIYSAERVPPAVQKAINFLNRSLDGDLWQTRDVAGAIGVSTDYFSHLLNHVALTDYRANETATRIYWGNKRTIKQFRKLNGKDNG